MFKRWCERYGVYVFFMKITIEPLGFPYELMIK